MIDPELIKCCQKGNEEAFDELYRSLYKKTVWTAFLVCGSMDKAEDIVQETFYECFRDVPKLRDVKLFQAWFNRILIRKCRKQMRMKFLIESLDDENAPDPVDDTSVTDIVETNRMSRLIREAVVRLSPPLRATVILYYYNGLSIAEIAKAMNCFQGTVKSRLHYAKRKLCRELANDYDCGNDLVYNGKPKEGTVL